MNDRAKPKLRNNNVSHELMERKLPDQSNDLLLKSINKKIQEIRTYVPKVGIFGNSGVGKSSLCNALFGQDIAQINDVLACTRTPQEILVGSDGNTGGIILVDLPGIGEDPLRQKEYTALYKSILPELDLIIWAIKADDRNYASGLETYKKISSRKNFPPVIFAITQADKTNDSDEWNRDEYTPGEEQLSNIAIKENDISRRFSTPTNNIISIAVEVKKLRITGRSYNLTSLVDRVVEVLPNEKKYSFTREAKPEAVSEGARESAEKGLLKTIIEFAGDAWESVKGPVGEFIVATATKVAKNAAKAVVDWFKSFW